MGVIERREREKEEMKLLILRAARTLFLDQGYEKTSIRSIAEAIEYSPATIYLYYTDKNDLFFALHQEAFQKLIAEFYGVLAIEDPFERLIQMGKYYLKYAFENPDLYDLMFLMSSPIENLACKAEVWEDGHIALGMLKNIVSECIEQNYFKTNDIDAAAMMIWSTVHGLAALHLKKRTMMFPEEERLPRLYAAFDLFTTVLKTGL